MSYGLRIKNDSLQLQIDSLYTNYVLYEHGESVSIANVSSPPINGFYYNGGFTFSTPTPLPPLIAIKPASSSYYCGVNKITKSGDNFTGAFLVGNGAMTFDWMAFVPQITKSSKTYGLRVYNENGTLCFDSGHRAMKILGVNTASPAYDSVTDINHYDDANAYFIISPWGSQINGEWPITFLGTNGAFIHQFSGMVRYIDSNTISFGGRQFFRTWVPGEVAYQYNFWPSLWTIITVEKAF